MGGRFHHIAPLSTISLIKELGFSFPAKEILSYPETRNLSQLLISPGRIWDAKILLSTITLLLILKNNKKVWNRTVVISTALWLW